MLLASILSMVVGAAPAPLADALADASQSAPPAAPPSAPPAAPPSAPPRATPPGRGPAAPPARPSAPAAPAAPAAPQQSTGPLRVEPREIALGTVDPGSRHPVKFTVRNVSKQPVTIIESKSSCKCTAITSLAGTVLQPGGTATIDATMDAPALPGDKDAHIFIIWDENAPPLTATIKAVVRMAVEAVPTFVDIRGGKLLQNVRVKAHDGKPFKILSAGGAAPKFGAGDSAAAAAGESKAEWEIVADFRGIPGDRMMQYWIVETSRDDCPVVPVQVRHEMTGVRFDEKRNQRFWIFGDSLVNAGRLPAGQAYDGVVEFSPYNPVRGSTAPPPPGWDEVVSLTSASPDGSAELLGTDLHGSKVVIRFRFTPSASSAGRCIYAPIELKTKTGSGLFYLVASVPAGGAK